MRKKRVHLIVKVCLALVILAGLAFLRQYLQQREDDAASSGGIPYAENVRDTHPLLMEFRSRYPDSEVLLACAEDITDDGLTDLVVISRLDTEITTIALLGGTGGNLRETEPIPAPREAQRIRFFNMDKSGAIEVLITGEKDGNIGYAIYRVMDGKLVNLFGEGMEECC